MPLLLLFIAVLALATSAPLIKAAAPAPALAVAIIRLSCAGLVFAAIAGPKLAQFFTLARRERNLAICAAGLLGLHFGVWISSLYLTSTAASTALVATQPIFAALFGWFLLKDHVGRREWAGIGVAAIGCALLAGGDLLHASRDAVLGDGLALAGAASAALYLAVGRRLRDALPLFTYLAVLHLLSAAFLCAAALLADVSLTGYPASSYAAMVASGLIPSVIGHTLLNLSVRRLPVHLVALAVLGEPLGASLLAYWFYAEVPSRHAIFGALILLVGIALGFVRRTAKRSPPAEIAP